jgi:hypothetical protein
MVTLSASTEAVYFSIERLQMLRKIPGSYLPEADQDPVKGECYVPGNPPGNKYQLNHALRCSSQPTPYPKMGASIWRAIWLFVAMGMCSAAAVSLAVFATKSPTGITVVLVCAGIVAAVETLKAGARFFGYAKGLYSELRSKYASSGNIRPVACSSDPRWQLLAFQLSCSEHKLDSESSLMDRVIAALRVRCALTDSIKHIVDRYMTDTEQLAAALQNEALDESDNKELLKLEHEARETVLQLTSAVVAFDDPLARAVKRQHVPTADHLREEAERLTHLSESDIR